MYNPHFGAFEYVTSKTLTVTATNQETTDSDINYCWRTELEFIAYQKYCRKLFDCVRFPAGDVRARDESRMSEFHPKYARLDVSTVCLVFAKMSFGVW